MLSQTNERYHARMRALAAYIDQELPAINAFLAQETEKLDQLVRPAAAHVLSAGGKRFRPVLAILCARALGHKGSDIYPLACSLEILHTATLLHDDILDGAVLRRGKAAAHIVFSRTEAVLAGDVLLALSNKLVAMYGDPRLTVCLSEAIMRTVTGEVAEIVNTREMDPSLETYLSIITGKTAYLIEASCVVGAMLAGADDRLIKAASDFGLNMGIAFQIVDDAMDYTSASSVSGKPAGGDLREGKLTLPLIGYLETLGPERSEALLRDIRAKTLGEADFAKILEGVQSGSHTANARALAGEYANKAARALEMFPDSEERKVLACALEFVLHREK